MFVPIQVSKGKRIRDSSIDYNEIERYSNIELSTHNLLRDLSWTILYSIVFSSIISLPFINFISFSQNVSSIAILFIALLMSVGSIIFIDRYEYVLSEKGILKFKNPLIGDSYVHGDIDVRGKDKKCMHPAITFDEIREVHETPLGNKIIESEFEVYNKFGDDNLRITDSSFEENRRIKIKDERLSDSIEEKIVSLKL
jgi:hypothetical protein